MDLNIIINVVNLEMKFLWSLVEDTVEDEAESKRVLRTPDYRGDIFEVEYQVTFVPVCTCLEHDVENIEVSSTQKATPLNGLLFAGFLLRRLGFISGIVPVGYRKGMWQWDSSVSEQCDSLQPSIIPPTLYAVCFRELLQWAHPRPAMP